MSRISNKMGDLNNHLFEQLEHAIKDREENKS